MHSSPALPPAQASSTRATQPPPVICADCPAGYTVLPCGRRTSSGPRSPTHVMPPETPPDARAGRYDWATRDSKLVFTTTSIDLVRVRSAMRRWNAATPVMWTLTLTAVFLGISPSFVARFFASFALMPMPVAAATNRP